jgi:DNA-binding winged helix-turn-helix (wHTH) protein/Tol biopolymer transport system component
MTTTANKDFRIGEWLVEPDLSTVSRNGTSTRLEPKVMEVLVCLASHAGAPVSKEKLLQTVWPETFVTDDVLTRCISELRKALDDDTKEPQFIQTIPRKGYRLVAEVKPLKPKRGKWRMAVALVVVASLAVLSLLFVSRNLRKAPGGSLSINRLTTSGKVDLSAISPDGRYLAYTEYDRDKQGLWLQQISSGSKSVLLPPFAVKFGTVRFSRDSNYIYYTRSEGGRSSLYQIPAIGGEPRKLMADLPSQIAISPDGKSVAFVRYEGEQLRQLFQDSSIVVKGIQDSAERIIATARESLIRPTLSWSPDGKRIAAVELFLHPAFGTYLMVVPAEGGPKVRIPRQGMLRIYQPDWLPDGSGLIAPAMGTHNQLWEFPYPNGESRRVNHDLLRYDNVSLTTDGRSLVSTQVDFLSSVWVGPASDPDKVVQVTPRGGHFVGMMGLTWTPHGRIIYMTNTSDQYDFIIMGKDGSDARTLPLDGYKWFPEVCPDGHTILFNGVYSGEWAIMRSDLDGGQPQLLMQAGADNTHCSVDGKWVVTYTPSQLVKVPIEGGTAIPLTDKPCDQPGVSPDGKWIACLYSTGADQPKLAIIPFSGGPPVKLFDLPATFDYDCCPLAWTPDGKAVSFVDTRGGSNLWAQPIEGGPSRQLTHFTSEAIAYYAWSRDGKQIAIARGAWIQDAVLITGFR